MLNHRTTETAFFEATEYNRNQTVEVRSRPTWVVILEFWFLWVHELWCHHSPLRIPTGNRRYWGDDAIEAAFHHFYSWTLNQGVEIDMSARFTDLVRSPREAEKKRQWDAELEALMEGE